MSIKDTNVRIPVVITEHEKQILEKVAKLNRRSLTNMISYILGAYVDGLERTVYDMVDMGHIRDDDELIKAFLANVQDSISGRVATQINMIMAETGIIPEINKEPVYPQTPQLEKLDHRTKH